MKTMTDIKRKSTPKRSHDAELAHHRDLMEFMGSGTIARCHICSQLTTLGQLNPFHGCEVCRKAKK